LEKNLKESNLSNLQDEMKIYSKQYKKLEQLTKFTIDLAKKNGLEAELLKDKRAQEFVALTTINQDLETPFLNYSGSGGQIKDNPIFQQLITQNTKMSTKLDTER
jgi:hypothetical protein